MAAVVNFGNSKENRLKVEGEGVHLIGITESNKAILRPGEHCLVPVHDGEIKGIKITAYDEGEQGAFYEHFLEEGKLKFRQIFPRLSVKFSGD